MIQMIPRPNFWRAPVDNDNGSLMHKKISDGKMHLIVPEKIGQVRMETIPVEALRDWMQDGGIR